MCVMSSFHVNGPDGYAMRNVEFCLAGIQFVVSDYKYAHQIQIIELNLKKKHIYCQSIVAYKTYFV